MKLKVVIDTNIAISGLLWKGAPNAIIKLARGGEIQLCCTEDMLDELKRVLKYEKFQQRMDRMGITKDDVLNYYMDIVSLYSGETKVDIIKTDPADNRFIEAAIVSKAFIIVSGDKHLLDLKEFEKIQILDSSAFMKLYEELKRK